MRTSEAILPAFNSGELSPELQSRVDINKYQTGLRRCRNFNILAQGGCENRPGFYYVATQKDVTRKARVVPYVFSQDQAYILEFSHNYIRFYTDDGQIQTGTVVDWSGATNYVIGDLASRLGITYYCIKDHTSQTPPSSDYWHPLVGSIYELPAPYTETDLPKLRFEYSADVIYIMHPLYRTRTLTRFGNTLWKLERYVNTEGPFMPENIDEAKTLQVSAVSGSGVTLTSSSDLFTALHVDGLLRLQHYVEGQSVQTAFTSATNGAAIKCFTTWRLISHGTWTGRFNVEKSIDGGSTWTVLRSFASVNDSNVNTSGTEDIEANPDPFLIRINFVSYTSGTATIDLSADPFYQEGIVEITGYTSPKVVTVNVLKEVGSTTATNFWAEGSWSDYRGWPELGVFHQDRFVLAGTRSEPLNAWGSETSIYTSFKRHSPLLDTDAIRIPLLSRQFNGINGLVSLGDLITLTAGSEWRIGSSSEIMTQTTVFAKAQGYRGSSGIPPVVLGNRIIYVQANGNTIRDFAFSLEQDGFDGADLSVLFRHRLKNYQIVDMAYQQDPNSIVWFLRDDGILLALTYMQEQDVVGWSWHDTDGEIESICTIPREGYNQLWASVKRGDQRFIERMAKRLTTTDPQDQYFLDAGISYDVPLTMTGATSANPIVVTAPAHGLSDGDLVDINDVEGMLNEDGESGINGNRYKVASSTTDTFVLTEEDSGDNVYGSDLTAYVSGGIVRKAFTVFSGVGHLEGRTVSILGNGEVYPSQGVTSGQITLSRACSRVHIGLSYYSDLETLNLNVPITPGSLQGTPVKVGNVTFQFLNSRGGWIGPNENDLYEAFIPERTKLGHPSPLFSGNAREPLGAGYEEGGRVFFRQKDPLPVTITGIIPEFAVAT